MIADAYRRCRGCRGTTCRAPTTNLRTRSFVNSHDPDLRSVPIACEKGGFGGLRKYFQKRFETCRFGGPPFVVQLERRFEPVNASPEAQLRTENQEKNDA